MTSFYANASIGVVVNDLQRSTLSYRLFQCLCSFSIKQYVKARWLISILRGFKRRVASFSEKLNFKKYKIQWKWAFRYQWIISKI
jgi:hypothetical protein